MDQLGIFREEVNPNYRTSTGEWSMVMIDEWIVD